MPETIKLLCANCKRATNHQILYEDKQNGSDDDVGLSWYERSCMVKCLGCDHVALYQEYSDSEMAPEAREEIYPDPVAGREPVRDYYFLPVQLREIYLETLRALDTKQLILTGIGIRAVVETVCQERKANGQNLKKKIDDLHTQGVLTKDGAELLHTLRVMGNTAAHEVKPHSKDELAIAIDVLDHLLLGVYILPKHAKDKLK